MAGKTVAKGIRDLLTQRDEVVGVRLSDDVLWVRQWLQAGLRQQLTNLPLVPARLWLLNTSRFAATIVRTKA
ncbi:hypothetical protein [Fibrella forsythiae]|uniref:Uncharacterized protein n=1 Tax=Fibrella forsythiae TaxID=2817061 RepID=A0ABS3JSZ1_9BACT|nr:hypothetical protein [Fibrella forsythiae]MBO0952573.1 hypothetical protein [Fibrella forsythiae]